MTGQVVAWAGCPECSPEPWPDAEPIVRDKRVPVDPDETHGGVRRRCPDCELVVRMSVGGPVLKAW